MTAIGFPTTQHVWLVAALIGGTCGGGGSDLIRLILLFYEWKVLPPSDNILQG